MSDPLSVDELEWEQEQMRFKTRRFLLANGWTYTSEIGSVWLYTKKIDGVTLAVNEGTALHLEAREEARDE